MLDLSKVKKVKLVCKNDDHFNEEFFCSPTYYPGTTGYYIIESKTVNLYIIK